MTVYGWDASNHDDPIRVRDGIDFYTHKAGEGHPAFYVDREYGASLNAARSLEIPILGAYFVNHPGTQFDQADWFVALLDSATPWWREHPCFVLQIDAERFDYMAREPTPQEIQAFGDRLVQAHGVDPRRVIAYAPRWLYGEGLTGLTYRLWASDYGGNPVMHYRAAYPGDGSKRWAGYSGQVPLILQYGSATTIGDQTTCDANAYRGTLDELLAELGAGSTPEEDDVLTAIWTKDTNGDDIIMYPWLHAWARVPKSGSLIPLENVLNGLIFAGCGYRNDVWQGPYPFSDPATWVWAGVEIKPEGAVTLSAEQLEAIRDAAEAGAAAGAPTPEQIADAVIDEIAS